MHLAPGHALLQLANAEGLYISEGPERLEIRLGSRQRPAVVRAVLRDIYDDSLEKVVVKHVPEPADAVIAAHFRLLGLSEHPS